MRSNKMPGGEVFEECSMRELVKGFAARSRTRIGKDPRAAPAEIDELLRSVTCAVLVREDLAVKILGGFGDEVVFGTTSLQAFDLVDPGRKVLKSALYGSSNGSCTRIPRERSHFSNNIVEHLV